MIRFIRQRKRRLKMKKVKEGDGHTLKEYRFWNIFTRSLFYIDITNDNNEKIIYAISCKYFAEEPMADLYRDGRHIAYSKLPAAFPVENGVIEIDSGGYGINRIRYATEEDKTYSVYPDKHSIRGWRMWLHKRFPQISRLIGILAIIVLLISLALSLPQLIEMITEIPRVSENIGTFESPIVFSWQSNTWIFAAGVLAGLERTLMLRNHWLIDMETSYWDS
ncbi:hypothetical protein OPHB3_0327 [Oceanobacillus picturae]|uniref:Uncharacterized protein n=1 Tax=Oceanobacillus picturae TaxID=171693 RepID=A0A0U9H1G7_9BACI|nr:hypothetical protein [Oceanobacillus picturae]GAQ16410.1 hypothetical protein OPHB3_0327 [Oceanobacillus picturae]